MTGDPVRNRRRLAAERARRARTPREVVEAVDFAPDGELPPLPPQVVPQAGEKLWLDTRKPVVVTLSEVRAGRIAGWRADCSACPGMAAGNGKGEAREKALGHVAEHRKLGHRVQLVEPLGRTKAKAKR